MGGKSPKRLGRNSSLGFRVAKSKTTSTAQDVVARPVFLQGMECPEIGLSGFVVWVKRFGFWPSSPDITDVCS